MMKQVFEKRYTKEGVRAFLDSDGDVWITPSVPLVDVFRGNISMEKLHEMARERGFSIYVRRVGSESMPSLQSLNSALKTQGVELKEEVVF